MTAHLTPVANGRSRSRQVNKDEVQEEPIHVTVGPMGQGTSRKKYLCFRIIAPPKFLYAIYENLGIMKER